MAIVKLHGSTAIQKINGVPADRLQKVKSGLAWAYYHTPVYWSTSDKNAGMTLAEDKLTVTAGAGSSWQAIRGDTGKTSGKWYAEISPKAFGTGYAFVGISDTALTLGNYCGSSTGSYGWWNTNTELRNAGTTADSGRDFSTSDVIQIAWDMDNRRVWFGANSTWLNAGDPAAGTNQSLNIGSTTLAMHLCVSMWGGGQVIANFGQSSFVYSPPAGFSRL